MNGNGEPFDVLVVGAGPAGLFTALGLQTAQRLRVIVIDAGPELDERLFRRENAVSERDYLVSGVGGAGLFSDGKLCWSLEVGGDLPSMTSSSTRKRLLDTIRSAFGFDASVLKSGERRVTNQAQQAEEAGLSFGHYPVFHVGTDNCANSIRHIKDVVGRQGSGVFSSYELQDLELDDNAVFRASVRTPNGSRILFARRVVLALGKMGADLQSSLCRKLGASSESLPMYVGLRLETSTPAIASLFGGLSDPKYKLNFDDGTKVKTHCASDGGEILSLRYNGLPLAGGHSYGRRHSGRSGFAVLWDGIRANANSYEYAMRLMKRASDVGHGGLVAQLLSDHVRGRRSEQGAIQSAEPSTRDWVAGDLHDVLPLEFFPRFDKFIEALHHLAPQIYSPKTVLFAPAIEWWMSRIGIDSGLQTAVPGLYVAGDGSGWSQGIVHSAATGLLVAEAISGRQLQTNSVVQATMS